jgi:YbbR domain-containing protein
MEEISFFEKIKQWFEKDSDKERILNRERVGIFIVSYIIALGLWFLVNLGREYNITVKIPIEVASVPNGKALISAVRDEVEANVSGEGWMLLNISSNKPTLQADLESSVNDDSIYTLNALESLRRQMINYPNLTLLKVTPQEIEIPLDDLMEKKVPVVHNLDINFRSQHKMIGKPRLIPDSVVITGAASKLRDINFWPTESLTLDEVRSPVDATLKLSQPSEMVNLSRESIRYRADVEEFTEGEVRVRVRTINLPRDADVEYDPSAITIKYDVPLSKYETSQDIIPYRVYVDYSEIVNDSTRFITPRVEPVDSTLNLDIRNWSPRRISYYKVIEE